MNRLFHRETSCVKCWVISLPSPGIKNLQKLIFLHITFVTLSKNICMPHSAAFLIVTMTNHLQNSYMQTDKHHRQQFTQCYCVIPKCTLRMHNIVCLMLELLLLFLPCVIIFTNDCILIGSCSWGCTNKAVFSKYFAQNFIRDCRLG
jgi:hypothetical protein